MPRFFLHVRDRTGAACDEDGVKLADIEAAIVEARRGIRSILTENVKAGILDLDGCVHITDHDGALIVEVQFVDAINIRFPGRSPIKDVAEQPL